MRAVLVFAVLGVAGCGEVRPSEPDAAPSIMPDAPLPPPGPQSCEDTTGITTVGYDLCVDGSKYILKCVCYDPTEPGDDFTRFDFDALLPTSKGDVLQLEAMNVNTIRLYSPRSSKIDGEWFNLAHLDTLYDQGIRVIIPVHSGTADDFHIEAVTRYDGHPAVLMYMIGNEISNNKFYTYDPSWTAETLVDYTNEIAAALRDAGATKPIAVSWGNPSDPDWLALRNLKVDIISYQIYEQLTFTTGTEGGLDIFTAHRLHGPPIPFFLSEYGADAFNASMEAGVVDEAAQALADETLTNLIKADALQQDNGISGGCVFSWTDGWWKAQGGDPTMHDVGGIPGSVGAGPYPDSIFNEEYWGLLDIDRTPRQAFSAMQSVYSTY